MYDLRLVSDMDAAHKFYNSHLGEPFVRGNVQAELALMPASKATVADWFAGDDRITVGFYHRDCLVGLASGVIASTRGTGFLSYICVDPAHRRAGLATRLMDELESLLLSADGVGKLEAVFHNPVHLPWFIPGGNGDYHPCLPGVDKASTLYLLLKNRGWRDYAHQNAYYRRMSTYEDRPEIAEALARLRADGIDLTFYNSAVHYGLVELFDNINNPGWKAHVMAHTDRPIVVAVDKNALDSDGRALVVGYTGPLSQDGTPARGNFCGIGTRTDYRGRGIGKQVFCAMCRAHRAAGAEFMSLYTGEDNPARNIYESAGFQVVRSFADMRKE